MSRSVVSDSLQPHDLYIARILGPWDSPGKNTGVGSHLPLQGILLTHSLSLGLRHCRRVLSHVRHQGSPEGEEAVPSQAHIGRTGAPATLTQWGLCQTVLGHGQNLPNARKTVFMF